MSTVDQKLNNTLASKLDLNSQRARNNSVGMAALVASIRQQEEQIREGGGAKAIEAQHAKKRLTAREKQVLQLIAQGNSNKDIARLLELSVNTVSVHRANLMEKMNIHRTAELVLFAIRKGLIAPQ